MSISQLPTLYSFRRCPYAMRARLALKLTNTQVQLREVVLKDKPTQLFSASAKGTVPVLVLPNDKVIDESLDIMLWALTQQGNQREGHEPTKAWLKQSQPMIELIRQHDNEFKPWLDKYKYADRYPELDQLAYRGRAELFVTQLENRLNQQDYLFGKKPELADYGIFPFIRQFASVDKSWFEQSPYPCTRKWLNTLVSSSLFTSVMQKYPQWNEEQPPLRF